MRWQCGILGIMPRHADRFLTENVSDGAVICARFPQPRSEGVTQPVWRQARLNEAFGFQSLFEGPPTRVEAARSSRPSATFALCQLAMSFEVFAMCMMATGASSKLTRGV